MGWVKIDDSFFTHRKVIGLSKDAKLLFVAGLTYCAAQLTDGLLDEAAIAGVARIVGVKAGARRDLVACGLWHELGHDCSSEQCPQPPAKAVYVHDYLRYQPPADKERARKALAAQRTERWRNSKGRGNAGGDAPGDAGSDASRMQGVRTAYANGARSPSPSPSPSPKSDPDSPLASDVNRTPSSSSDDDDRRTTITDALHQLAQRALDRRNRECQAKGRDTITGRARTEAWIAEDITRTREHFEPLANRYLDHDPTLDANAIADLLDTPAADAFAHLIGGTP